MNVRQVSDLLEKAVRAPGFDPLRKPEVAFYGGTFTGLPKQRMMDLLGAVQPYIGDGSISSIRVSTRPDLVLENDLTMLRRLGVLTVELGAQSMDNRVLDLSERGHSAEDTIGSVRLLRRYGFRVGMQLMPGLPGDSETVFLRTVEQTIDLRPDMARIYPSLVIRGTELERLYREGHYRPLPLDRALKICEEACLRLEDSGIPVIRIGILNAPALAERGDIIAGPWHASFGSLVRCGVYWRRIEHRLPRKGEAREIGLHVHRNDLPLIRGHGNAGLRLIEERTGAIVREIHPDDLLPKGEIRVEKL